MTSLYKDDAVEYKAWNHYYTLDERKRKDTQVHFRTTRCNLRTKLPKQEQRNKKRAGVQCITARQHYIILHRRHNHDKRKENNGTIAYHNTENALLHRAKTNDNACQYSNRPNQRRREGTYTARYSMAQRGTAHPRRRGASGDVRIHMKTKSLFTSSCKAKAYLLKPSPTSLTPSLILHDDSVPWSVPSRGGQWGGREGTRPRGEGERRLHGDDRCGRLQPP